MNALIAGPLPLLAICSCQAGVPGLFPTLSVPAETRSDEIEVVSASSDQGRVAQTSAGTYRVSWHSVPDPIPENEPFSLQVEVKLANSLDPVPQDLALRAGAWMPMHRHGMLRQPLVTRLGDGLFSVEAMLLHMKGEWQLTFDILHDGRIERAQFDLLLEPTPGMATREFTPDEVGTILSMSPLPPVPDDPTNAYDTNEGAARLGQYLFFDRRLSRTGTVSCSSCHVPDLEWTDGKPLADVGTRLSRNTPSLWNAAYGRWFFWDGRADTLWSQALHPLEEPREQGANRVGIARLLSEDHDMRRAYTEVFGALPEFINSDAGCPAAARPGAPDDPLTVAWEAMSAENREAINHVFTNVGKAIAAFERKIVTISAPFDRFVRGLRSGDPALLGAISPQAREGLRLFIGKANCHLCHSGPYFSDREFHKERVPVRAELPRDLGRSQGRIDVKKDPFNGLGRFADGHDGEARNKLDALSFVNEVWGEFKTPSLRNVARTAPYMHQGQFATLGEVIDFYSEGVPSPTFNDHLEQVLIPLYLTDEEKTNLLAFLESLTDDSLPEDLRRSPTTPYIP